MPQRNSNEGWNAGRSVPCPLKNMKPFLHKYLRKWTPPPSLHRQNAMPHIKTYARFDPSDSNRGTLDWALLTSSNLSKAAWGSYQKNQTQFMIRSYELGVMFLPTLLAIPRERHEAQPLRLGVVGSMPATQQDARLLLPLPYAFPLTTYDPKKDEPWVWDLVREDPDIFGASYMPC
jgi:tyrosyl-DNA phosphodiesterase-1